MNLYSQYIEIFYYNRWQIIVNIFKYFTIRHLTYTCHLLSKFKVLIPDDIQYFQSSNQNMFPTFIYDSIHTQRKKSMDYIIKLLAISPIFLMEGLSNSTLVKRLCSLLWFLCTSRVTQHSYIITSCNIPSFTFVVFRCTTTFSSSHFS